MRLHLNLVIPVFFLAGCQTNSVSLQEAKQLTAEFRGSSFTPPPRSIDDLYRYLPSPEISPTQMLAEQCNGKEKEGKWGKLFTEYLKYYAPNDFIKTDVHPIGRWNFRQAWELYRGISISEIQRGNLFEAAKVQKTYLKNIPDDKNGARIPGNAQLAIIHVGRGDIEDAQTSIRTALSWESRLTKRPLNKIGIHDAWVAQAQGSLAKANGDLEAAEAFYRKALAKHSQYMWLGAGEVSLIQSRLAEVIAAQGRLLEAEIESRQAIKHSIDNGRVDKTGQAQLIYRYAKILLDQGRIKEAEQIARSAVWVFQKNCSPSDSVEYAEARRILAESLAWQGRYDEVIELYRVIEKSMSGSGLFERRFANDLTYSYALLLTDNHAASNRRLQKTVSNLEASFGARHPRTAEAKGLLAIANWKAGRHASAETYFQDSFGVLQNPEQRSGVSPHYLRIIIEAYMDMVSTKAVENVGAANTLFMLAEQLRNSSVQKSIAAMGARAAAGTPELASLLRDEQDLAARLKALESTLSNAISENVDSSQLKSDVERLRQAHAVLMAKILENFPDYAELLSPATLDVGQVQQVLADNEVLISTYSNADKTYVWTVGKNKPVSFHIVDISSHALELKIAKLKEAFKPKSASLASIQEFDVTLAHQLFKAVFEPSRSVWQKADTIFISAHAALGHLPMSVLPAEKFTLGPKKAPLFSRYKSVPYWVKSHAITNLPSAYALIALRNASQYKKSQQKFIGFGDPWFNEQHALQGHQVAVNLGVTTRGGIHLRSVPNVSDSNSADISMLPRLPETADELMDIARTLGVTIDDNIFIGPDANEINVKQKQLNDYQVVAFATHGLIPGELDGLRQPALALSSPLVSNTNGDGLLTMDEIMNLDLNADWVVLSACNTGSSDGAASEAVSGLGRAFFYAGARSLLVSNWPVETQSARLLTTEIFKEEKAGKSKAHALQSSMNSLIEHGSYNQPETGKLLYSYSHPIFWAPFTLVGDSGG